VSASGRLLSAGELTKLFLRLVKRPKNGTSIARAQI